MPPMAIGGAEIQALHLYNGLTAAGIKVKMITWGKLWHKRKGSHMNVPFVRIKSFLNLITDIPSVFKKKSATIKKTRIIYDDKLEVTNQMTGKVWLGMILRYRLFYINCLVYLWIRRRQFDIIHVHMMEWPAIVAVKIGRRLNKQVVIKDSTMNGIYNLLRYPDGEKKQQEIAGYAYCVAMTRMIHSNYLKAGIPPERIADIPNGIYITPKPIKNKAWNYKVIFVGNLTQQPAKGIDILLLAWKKVIASVPNASLHIVGSGDIETYELFTRSEGINESVVLLGKRQNVRELLLESDVFVLPSRREGMSNALMEAMLCAMPIIATEVSGSQDLIQNEVSGLLVPIADVNKLATAIIYMLKQDKHALQMGENAYNSIVEKCDMKKIALKYEQLYQKILQKA